MSKNRNKRNTRSSLKALKRKRYAEGGQQLYAQRKGEDLDDYQARVTAAQAADTNFNTQDYQQALRSGTQQKLKLPHKQRLLHKLKQQQTPRQQQMLKQ